MKRPGILSDELIDEALAKQAEKEKKPEKKSTPIEDDKHKSGRTIKSPAIVAILNE
ncbi:MAG: hypothetical protein ACLUD2_15565 [Clostridium sp.]